MNTGIYKFGFYFLVMDIYARFRRCNLKIIMSIISGCIPSKANSSTYGTLLQSLSKYPG